MLTFKNVTVQGCKAIPTYSPDNRSLSIILEGAETSDEPDLKSFYTAKSIDLDIDLTGNEDNAACKVDIRGHGVHSGKNSFGILRLQANGKRSLVSASEGGEIFTSFYVPIDESSRLAFAALLLANAGNEDFAFSQMTIDSIDLRLGNG